MKYLTINKKKLTIPTRWDEVTFKQYIKYTEIEKPEYIDVVALFTGISRKKWEDSKEIENFYLIIDALKFIDQEPAITDLTNPGAVEIKGKEYRVPQNLKQYTVKQFEDMRGIIRMEQKKDQEITIKLYPKIISIYFCPLIFGDYTVENIKKTEPLIEGLTIYEVAGIGNFFLRNFGALLSGTRNGKRVLSTITRKLKRVFTG